MPPEEAVVRHKNPIVARGRQELRVIGGAEMREVPRGRYTMAGVAKLRSQVQRDIIVKIQVSHRALS